MSPQRTNFFKMQMAREFAVYRVIYNPAENVTVFMLRLLFKRFSQAKVNFINKKIFPYLLTP